MSVPILVFLGLSVLDLGPMYETDRQTDRRQTRIVAYASALYGAGYNNNNANVCKAHIVHIISTIRANAVLGLQLLVDSHRPTWEIN